MRSVLSRIQAVLHAAPHLVDRNLPMPADFRRVVFAPARAESRFGAVVEGLDLGAAGEVVIHEYGVR
jgi:hypothetical protein